jgi:hypothetical protein
MRVEPVAHANSNADIDTLWGIRRLGTQLPLSRDNGCADRDDS